MYKILFAILFAGAMWMGYSKAENLAAARAKSQVFTETIPTIGLGPFLQMTRMGNIIIIDMRHIQDYDHAHIKDALSMHHLDVTGTSERLNDRLRKARNVVLYSSGGVTDQMRQYAKILSEHGIQGATFYSGGFREWLAAGLPVVVNN